MRSAITILLIFLNIPLLSAQKKIYLDENGNEIKERIFRKKWHDKKFLLSRWDYIGENGKRYCKLKKDLYLVDSLDYLEIKTTLELTTNRKIKHNTILLIEYHYKNDLCSNSIDNRWPKDKVAGRKEFLNPQLIELKKENIMLVCLFETGILLQNNIKILDEYFYLDSDDFFRKKIFTNPTLCGSYALIKPNGQTLIRNGEFRPDWMANHLKSEYWKVFFP